MLRDRCPQPPPTSRREPRSRPSECAQSTLEFVGTLPLLALAATCCLQALLVALGVVFAQSAADRAARGAPTAQVVSSIPSGWRSRTRVTTTSSSARVTVRPPALVPGTGRWLAVQVTSEASS